MRGGRAVQVADQQVADAARQRKDRRRVVVRLQPPVGAVPLQAREAGDLAVGYRLAGVDHAEAYGRDGPDRFDGLQQGDVQAVVDPGDRGPYPARQRRVGDVDGARLDHMGAGEDQPVGEEDAAALLVRGDDHRTVGQGHRADGLAAPSPDAAGDASSGPGPPLNQGEEVRSASGSSPNPAVDPWSASGPVPNPAVDPSSRVPISHASPVTALRGVRVKATLCVRPEARAASVPASTTHAFTLPPAFASRRSSRVNSIWMSPTAKETGWSVARVAASMSWLRMDATASASSMPSSAWVFSAVMGPPGCGAVSRQRSETPCRRSRNGRTKVPPPVTRRTGRNMPTTHARRNGPDRLRDLRPGVGGPLRGFVRYGRSAVPCPEKAARNRR
ncbi:hypothetical protein SCALM49S_05860 [Streptomyces californicus]